MLGGFLLLAADGAAYYGLSRVLPMEGSLLIVAAVNAVLAIFLSWRMRRTTENLFIKLQA
jgi:type VI protein secretion system component VasF